MVLNIRNKKRWISQDCLSRRETNGLWVLALTLYTLSDLPVLLVRERSDLGHPPTSPPTLRVDRRTKNDVVSVRTESMILRDSCGVSAELTGSPVDPSVPGSQYWCPGSPFHSRRFSTRNRCVYPGEAVVGKLFVRVSPVRPRERKGDLLKSHFFWRPLRRVLLVKRFGPLEPSARSGPSTPPPLSTHPPSTSDPPDPEHLESLEVETDCVNCTSTEVSATVPPTPTLDNPKGEALLSLYR